MENKNICNKCIIDNAIPSVIFDDKGVCNYCHLHEEMNRSYPISNSVLSDYTKQIKLDGLDREYDAVIGISGGCDSSYLLYLLHSLGLRLLAVHIDNNWNTTIAKSNIEKMVKQLDINLDYITLDKNIFNSLCRSFLFAGTPDADIPNDLALLEGMHQTALDKDIKWVINGHSFRTEGSAPLGWTYMDGGYLEDVNRKYENIDISGFPHFSFDKQKEYWDNDIKTFRPLYYIDYNKRKAINFLTNMFNWEWYEGLHAENIYTKFVGRYLWVKKFGIDYRKIEYSALVRSYHISRYEALNNLSKQADFEPFYLKMVIDNLDLTEEELNEIIFNREKYPIRSYKDFDNYLSLFKNPEYKTFFNKLLIEEKIPYTFYKKYVIGV